MDFLAIALIAFFASALTLYSGFGLGTLLLPAFAVFLPIDVAVAATAVVHLLTNLFKGGLLFGDADWRIVTRFGAPAIVGAFAGAWILGMLGQGGRVFEWGAFGHSFGPTPAGLAIGALLVALAALELTPAFQRLQAPARLMPLGGAITGFIGGLTGQQGALRAIFLIKSGLKPAGFIATGVMIAVLIDLARLPVYALALEGAWRAMDPRQGWLIAAGAGAAFAGAWLGARYIAKTTIGAVRMIVAAGLFVIGAALAAGLIGAG